MLRVRTAAALSHWRARARVLSNWPARLVLLCVLSDLASGLDIIPVFDMTNTDTYIDPDGFDRTLELIAVMNVAAAHWEDLVQDTHTLTLTYLWDDLGPMGGTANHSNFVIVDGREISGELRFGTLDYGPDPDNPAPMPWWLDTSPAVDSEFEMTQTLYNDLSPGERLDYFTGSPPFTFEAGYEGAANSTAPSQARDWIDLLSSALHEMGHALGLTNQVAGGETLDLDFDVDPGFVHGAAMAVNVAGPDDRAHLASSTALMTTFGTKGMRRRPSAADVLSIAASSGWSDIDLPRQDFLCSGDWNDPFNWLGGTVPDVADEAYIRPPQAPTVALLSTSTSAARLVVAEGSHLSTNGNLLTIGGVTTIDGEDTKILVDAGGTLRTSFLEIQNGGELDMAGGLTDVNDALTVSPGSMITGRGIIDVASQFVNAGFIRPDGGTLTLDTTGNGVWDLDGDSSSGQINCASGDLNVKGTLRGDFGGTATVGSGHTIKFSDGWTLAASGKLNLNGTSSTAAVIGTSVINGDVLVSGMGEFLGGQTFGLSAAVQLPNPNDTLSLNGPTTFDGVAVTGKGILRQLNDVTVLSDTTLSNAVHNWGNSVPGMVNETTVHPNATFTIKSSTTQNRDNEYRGTIRLNNGELDVQTSSGWTLPSDGGAGDATPGVLVLNNNNEDRTIPTLRGSELTLAGLLQSTGGRGVIESALITQPTGEIEVQTAAELWLAGRVAYDGALVHGNGTLVQRADADVISSTTIGTNFYDWDGGEAVLSDTTIAAGAALMINSSQIETNPPATDGYDGHVTLADTSALVVSTASPWRLDGTMTLQGQPVATPSVIVDGSDLINYGMIEGNGRIQSSLENHGALSPGLSAGVLRFQAGFTLAADGVVQIELGGLTPVTEYDRIVINQFGTANLGGALEVSLIDGFVPQDGDAFTILTAGVVSGSFNDAAVTGVNFPPGVLLNVLYNPSNVMLLFDVDYAADFNMDGVVDGNDLLIWQASFGVDAGGDADGDNDTDGADFHIWQQQLGSGLPASPVAAPANVGVPEPGTCILLLISGALAARRLRVALAPRSLP